MWEELPGGVAFISWFLEPIDGLTPQTDRPGGLGVFATTIPDRVEKPVHRSMTHYRQEAEAAQCPLRDEWTNEMWSSPTREYYSALKRNEILTQATRGMDLEGWELNKASPQRENTG